MISTLSLAAASAADPGIWNPTVSSFTAPSSRMSPGHGSSAPWLDDSSSSGRLTRPARNRFALPLTDCVLGKIANSGVAS